MSKVCHEVVIDKSSVRQGRRHAAIALLALPGVFACSSLELDAREDGIAEVAPLPDAVLDGMAEPRSRGHFGSKLEELERERAQIRPFASGAATDNLREYAAKCAIATGVSVPAFRCSDGIEVPGQDMDANFACDQPNRLNRECDKGSRFQVLVRTPSAVVVAHCRKDGQPVDNNLYNDIAVIQYNKQNGAVCFYQALSNLDGDTQAPSEGEDAWEWLSPATTHGIDCGGCHDTGGILRSPYLAQLDSGPHALPGAPVPGTHGAETLDGFDNTNPVSYIGADFQDWESHAVETTSGLCTNCHRLAVNNVAVFGSPVGARGTAREFALTATGPSEVHKKPHGPNSPIWMLPDQIEYVPAIEAIARTYSDCARRFTENGDLTGCTITPLTKKWDGLTPAHIPAIF